MSLTLDLTTVLLAIISALSAVSIAYITQLRGKVEAVHREVDIVHGAVNSNYSRQVDALNVATAQLVAMNQKLIEQGNVNATLAEQVRGMDLAKATAAGIATGLVLPVPVPVTIPLQLIPQVAVVEASAVEAPININAPVVHVSAPPNAPEIVTDASRNRRVGDNAT
jgi:hypothetical protein